MIIKSKVIESGSLIKDKELIYCTIEAGCSFVNCYFYGCHTIGLSDFNNCNFHNCNFHNCIFTKKEYTKDEYAAEALKLQKQIDALLVKLNFYNSKK